MSAVSKNRVARLISQIGSSEDVHGAGSLTVAEAAQNTVTTDASKGKTTFFLDLDGSTARGLAHLDNNYAHVTDATLNNANFTWWMRGVFEGHGYWFKRAAGTGDEVSIYFDINSNRFLVTFGHGPGAHPNNKWQAYAGPFPTLRGSEADVTMTYDGTDFKIYLDAVLAFNTAAYVPGGNAPLGHICDPAQPYWVGGPATHYPIGSPPHETTLYDAAVWNSALTLEQIQDLKNNNKTPITLLDASNDPDPAMSYWPYNDAITSTSVADAIESRNLTITGALTTNYSWPTISQHVIFQNPTGAQAGQILRWIIKLNGAVGLRTVNFGSMFKSADGAGLQISQAAGSRNMIEGVVSADGTEIYCKVYKDYA